MPLKSEALTVNGVPEWLRGAVERSLNAVWSEIPNDSGTDREGTLSLVASRLFTGYDVKVKAGREDPAVFLYERDEFIRPDVKIIFPELREMSLNWFSNDISGMSEEVSEIAGSIPQSALTWADNELRLNVSKIINSHLPGWDFTQQIYISPEKTQINLSFRPSAQMVLAVKPSLYSRTVPVMFQSDLEAKLIPELSPLIGMPVKWVEKHKSEIEDYVKKSLEDRNTVENLKANVTVDFKAGKISEIEAGIDSKNFMFSVWVSAYAGISGRYPEAGIFFGFRPLWRMVENGFNFAPEIYAEMIFSLDDFGFTQRLGGRFELINNFWAGAEFQWPDSDYYFRLQYIPVKIRRPYALWRYSPSGSNHEAAIGYKFDEHISIEVYYDSSGEDKLGLRGTWHL